MFCGSLESLLIRVGLVYNVDVYKMHAHFTIFIRCQTLSYVMLMHSRVVLSFFYSELRPFILGTGKRFS